MKYYYDKILVNCYDYVTVKKEENSIYLFADMDKKLKILFEDNDLCLTLFISGLVHQSMIIRKRQDHFVIESDLDCEVYQLDQNIVVSLNVESYSGSTSMEVELYYKGDHSPVQVTLLARTYIHKEYQNEPCF